MRSNFDLAATSQTQSITLLIGGTHGDEKAAVPLLEQYAEERLRDSMLPPTVILPLLNPDGFARDSRYNARGVDLNRNFPHLWKQNSTEPSGTKALSEPESLALSEFILKWRPRSIVSLHWALSEIDPDGPQSDALARAMWDGLSYEERKPYRLRQSRNPLPESSLCPGSLGQWCGFALDSPLSGKPAMITLELPYDPNLSIRPEMLPETHLEDVVSLWRRDSETYLRGVEKGVRKILDRAAFGSYH